MIISGQSTWDRGFETLSSAFERLTAEADRRGVKVAGRPLTVFIETDEWRSATRRCSRSTARLKPAARPTSAGADPHRPRAALRPSRPFDDIEQTYEGITAYLDAKGVVVRDQFVEEYLNPLRDSSEANFDVNIYVPAAVKLMRPSVLILRQAQDEGCGRQSSRP